MKNIKIYYYASLREQRNLSEESIQTQEQTAEALYKSLKVKYKFTLDTDILRVSVNDEFVDWSAQINDNDEVVFIPPVAGG